ncbi:MAG: hypothetical protein COA96_01985 [SAR86 cluster bacterium]|uniref:Uncharacterized protein n=1 Tax=SAR86 cluster bacterium TaxID=2030880 RepID=A0A2A5BAC4_9GAMM|nr:MAG: hypothetical protein COA96_01985 [SAR86 cluster bacterium]
MERQKHAFKPIAYGVIIFVTLGMAIANETLSRFGLESNYIAVFSVAFILVAILLSKNLIMLVVVITGVIALNLPEALLLQYHLDRDVLLAVVCAAILVPSVYDLFAS